MTSFGMLTKDASLQVRIWGAAARLAKGRAIWQFADVIQRRLRG